LFRLLRGRGRRGGHDEAGRRNDGCCETRHPYHDEQSGFPKSNGRTSLRLALEFYLVAFV
jgi:hypothetical protein